MRLIVNPGRRLRLRGESHDLLEGAIFEEDEKYGKVLVAIGKASLAPEKKEFVPVEPVVEAADDLSIATEVPVKVQPPVSSPVVPMTTTTAEVIVPVQRPVFRRPVGRPPKVQPELEVAAASLLDESEAAESSVSTAAEEPSPQE